MHNTIENMKWRATGSFADEDYIFSGFSCGPEEDGNRVQPENAHHGSLIKNGSIEVEQGGQKEQDKGVHDSF